MNKSNKTYKPSKPNKILKGIFAFIAAATFVFSAAACTPTQPNTPVDPKPPVTDIDPNEPDKPTDPTQKDPTQKDPNEKDPNENPTNPGDNEQEEVEKQAFENAKTEYNTYVSNLFVGKNFTYQEDHVKTELADGKAKVTMDGKETYFAKEDNILYNFTKDDKGEWKKEEEKEITLEKIENDIKNKLTIENDSWTKLDNETLIGKLGNEEISAEVDEENNTLTLKIGHKTITISDIEKTVVIIPEIKEEFDVYEHIDELEKQVKKFMDSYADKNKINEIFNFHLKDDDTFEIVYEYTPKNSTSKSFVYSEITIDNVPNDLTYENICKDGIPYNARNVRQKQTLNYNISPSAQTTYVEGIDILFNQLFEPNVRDGATWSGCTFAPGAGSFRSNVYLFKNNEIKYVTLDISSDGGTLDIVNSIKQNFYNQPEKDNLSTWKCENKNTIQIPSDSINFWEYHQNNIEEE